MKLLWFSLFVCIALPSCDSGSSAAKGDESGESAASESAAKALIDPKALVMLDEGVVRYRKLATSIKNGLNSRSLKSLANDADFSLRELDTYLEAKKISLETIGISDLGELADEWQGLLKQYNAGFLKPFDPKHSGEYSSVYVNDLDEGGESWTGAESDFSETSFQMHLIYFQRLIERFPSLTTKFYCRIQADDSKYNMVSVSPEAIKFASEFEPEGGHTDEQFFKKLKSIPFSGYGTKNNFDTIRHWRIFFDGKVVKSLLINDLSKKIDKVNLLIKEAM